MDAVAGKMIVTISILSILVAIAGGVFYFVNQNPVAAGPFALGVAAAMGINIVKVLWLKNTVNKAVDMEANAARRHLQWQYLMRMVFTLAVFLVVVFIPFANFVGTAIGIFTFPVAMHLMRLFFKDTASKAG